MQTPTLKNDLVLRAARGERTSRTPVWFMRQAGRFDPAYRALKAREDRPLEAIFADPDVAAEVTLLPLRYDVDALILFQDILTLCGPMGARFVFRPGPTLERPLRTPRDVRRLRSMDPEAEMPFVVESITNVLRATGDRLPLLGFAGAPLTVAAFLVAGKSPSAALTHLRIMMRELPADLHALLDHLARHTSHYLDMKIRAGVHAVQLFESMADRLTSEEYATWALPYQRRVFESLREPSPRIMFAKGLGDLDALHASGAECLSVSSSIDIAAARTRSDLDGIGLQGNVSNVLLRDETPDVVERETRRCIDAGAHRGHILNLDHGLFPTTPPENVVRAIHVAKTYTQGGPWAVSTDPATA